MSVVRSLLLTGLLIPCASAQEGGIELFTGETLFSQGLRLGWSQLETDRSDLFQGTSEVRNSTGRRLEESRSVLLADYGLGRDLTITVLVPFVRTRVRDNGLRETTSGLGDIALAIKALVYRELWAQGSFNVSLVGGVELPTGVDDERRGGQLLAPELQPGRGATNPFLASAFTYEQGRWRYDANLFVKANGDGAQNFQRGTFWSAEATMGYRFLHRPYPGPTAVGKLGLKFRRQERDELDGDRLLNSGSNTLFAVTGFSIHPQPAMDLSLGLELPITEDYNGEQLGRGTRLLISLGWRF